ncbi:MAG: sigma factor-like helix-turn-helix DNA-binding protein [Candidatus Jorgensenbacteria bacterium]|nr:sigma factor-like helix-turn-helix DNA-binding protein [Candidatus Jorgensenbacteria bacterium]
MIFNLEQLIAKFLEDFSPKQKRVITGRFGLKDGKRATLQEIGDEFGITRERVRQIEESAIKRLTPQVKEAAASLINGAAVYLESAGGARRDEEFMSDMEQKFLGKGSTRYAPRKLAFIFLIGGAPRYEKENDDMHAYWYSDDKSKQKLSDFVRRVVKFFKTSDKDGILIQKKHLKEFPDLASQHFLTISKHFGKNVFGDFGLKAWPEIEPKTIRDKAYLVLKKHNKPLHFENIAKFISTYGIDVKPAHIQTVHNELIKDDRFVLVGRGIYALREHGYEPGTVREVIVRLLKKHGPLKPQDVVKMVNEQRLLKENTILLSLQNRKDFKRLDDGKYHILEA